MSQRGRGGYGNVAGRGGGRGGRGGGTERHHRVDTTSPYWQGGFHFDSEIRSRHLRDLLETPGRLSPPNCQKRGIIQDHVISLFRLLVLYGPFQNQGARYWLTVAEDFGWDVHDVKTTVRIYITARQRFLDTTAPLYVLYPDRESDAMAALVDKYTSHMHLQDRPAYRLSATDEQHVEALRDAWRAYPPQDLLVEQPTLPPLPDDQERTWHRQLTGQPEMAPQTLNKENTPIKQKTAAMKKDTTIKQEHVIKQESDLDALPIRQTIEQDYPPPDPDQGKMMPKTQQRITQVDIQKLPLTKPSFERISPSPAESLLRPVAVFSLAQAVRP
ncbi:hypothetical protein GE09DRAFT_1213698 [Coniochaeta sp. 2T2.1]|nr:hypothetical protein GE09DRAFT_1213698 [Coniochaeta sp. 2T2.1]